MSNSGQLPTAAAGQPWEVNPIRILLVEDNAGDARLLGTLLGESQRFVFNLHCVDRVAEAVELLSTETFDVVLLDLSLPDSHGIETLAKTRSGAPGVPIIVLTGLDDEATGVTAVKMGAQDFLVKGQIDGDLIVRAVRYAIERQRVEQHMRRQQERLTALCEIHKAISSTLDLSSILHVLIEKSSLVIPDAAVTVELWNEDTKALEPATCRNLDERVWKAELRDGGNRASSMVLQKRAPVIIPDFSPPRGFDSFSAGGFVAYVGVPLLVKGEPVGVLGIYSRENRACGNEEIDFLAAISAEAAVAIRNAQLYERMRDQAIQLERANGVKNEFISIVSHELKTPVNVIMGYTNLLGQQIFGQLNAEQQTALSTVASSARALLEMINDILQVVCLESGRLAPGIADVDLAGFMTDLRAVCRMPSGKQVTLHWDVSGDLPMIRTDADMLKQIVLHLINNAVKFTDRGEVNVALSYVQQHDRFELRVKDSGIGIKPEMLRTIFEKFQQVDGSSTRPHEGIGLGLYIVKNLTELLGGSVAVRSEAGKGSVFTVTLPRQDRQRLADALKET